MPGILPMKVIKVGTSAQARIAQACDRCRSKKIRCDGVRPCCSQCANVGFECKTSDKLSRRAFPRGYTESLEERVRGLEAEVRELKDLLDEKDEKIDMLSRIHSTASHPIQLPSPRRPSISLDSSGARNDTPPKDESFNVQQSPDLFDDDHGSSAYFSGTSSARTFVEAFKHRVQESGRSAAAIDTRLLLSSSLRRPSDAPATPPASPVVWKAPPRLISDQLVNIFFQEWAPLFPVLHRPTFLTLYEKYVADNDSVLDKAEIAQLNLVFGIASLASGARSPADVDSFETQWKSALGSIITENSMSTLQTLILAQIYCIQQGDLTRLLTYKGLSTSLSARLGLQQSQKRFSLGTLTCETRKKVFWTLYTVDSFTAVALGLPKHLKDEDVQCEYPVDVDDEYVTESGFQPTLPGESTKLSSALALFRASRILSKVLEEVFPAKASYDLSLRKIGELSDELDAWNASLAPHLRLHFAQDKPGTGTISSRSPLLAFTYQYIRALLQRPVLCAALGAKESPYLLTMASASKHMIQIAQLLEERGLSFSFCLNRDAVLVVAGFGLLFQGLGLDRSSRLLKDNGKMAAAVSQLLEKSAAPCAPEFARVVKYVVPVQQEEMPRPVAISRRESDGALAMPSHTSTRKQLKAIASRFAASNAFKPKLDLTSVGRRATVHGISLHPHSPQSQSVPSLQPPSCNAAAPTASRSEPPRSPVNMFSRPASAATGKTPLALPPSRNPNLQLPPQQVPNLDYLSFGSEPGTPQGQAKPAQSAPVKPEPGPTDWEKLLGSLDNGDNNIFDACYGGPSIDALIGVPPLEMQPSNGSAPAVNDDVADLWALCQTESHETSGGSGSGGGGGGGNARSMLSLTTDEGGSSGEDFYADWASASSSSFSDAYRGIVMPASSGGDDVASWEMSLAL